LIVVLAQGYGILVAGWVAFGIDLAILIVLALTVRRFEEVDYPLWTALFFTGGIAALAMWAGFAESETAVVQKLFIVAGVTVGCISVWIWPRRALILQLTRG
jgi:hypothetical protein